MFDFRSVIGGTTNKVLEVNDVFDKMCTALWHIQPSDVSANSYFINWVLPILHTERDKALIKKNQSVICAYIITDSIIKYVQNCMVSFDSGISYPLRAGVC